MQFPHSNFRHPLRDSRLRIAIGYGLKGGASVHATIMPLNDQIVRGQVGISDNEMDNPILYSTEIVFL